ncbi:MAG: hypothetical protein PUD53_01640 [Oscillospiraceae bacterium]|nr:hypothetical protein [Oscillospiraceae bacterium]
MTKYKSRVGAILMAMCICTSSAIVMSTPVNAAKKRTTYVYVTKTGKKYHSTKKCRTLARSKYIARVTKTSAKKKYTACKVCH